MLSIDPPFKVYTGLDGKPLDGGYIYFGPPSQNPKNPTQRITVFWDAAGTQPAAQPLRTVSGYIMRAGTPANVFIDGEYSVLVQDKKGVTVFYWAALAPERPVQMETQTATAGQTVFTLKQIGYTPGIGSLHVYVDGFRLSSADYQETARDTVTFTRALVKDQEVLFEAGSGVNSQSVIDAAMIPYTPAGGVNSNVQEALDAAAGKLQKIVQAEDYFIAGEADSTAMLQRAIDAVYSAGGGEVHLTGEYFVSASTSTEQFWYASITAKAVASDVTALVLRSGVALVGQGPRRSKITGTDRARTVICAVSMDGGGLRNLHVRNGWTPALSGAGHGVLLAIAELNDSNQNLVFERLEVSNVGSYGIGAQWGNYHNNRYDSIYVHDTGADAIDHKVRGGTNMQSRGVSFSNILCERYGQRAGIVNSAGIDARGPVTITNYVARDFGAAGGVNVGIRFSAGVYDATGVDNREPSSGSSLANFLIESDHAYSTSGVVLLSSEATKVVNGTIKNTNTFGVSGENSSSGYGTSSRARVSSVSVSGTRAGTAFRTVAGAEGVVFAQCDSWGAYDEFSSARGNLAAGQTIFTASYDPASVQVYKNSALLVNDVDVTATSGTSVTLAAAVLSTDVIAIVTPNAKGFDIAGNNNAVTFCGTKYTTVPETISGGALPSFRRSGNNYEGAGGVRSVDNGTLRMEVFGPAANIDYRVDAKGTGAFEARSNAQRAFRALNVSSNAVNWVQAAGSATGLEVAVSFQGTDVNGNISLRGKGTGYATLADQSGNAKVSASTTGLSFYGAVPAAKPAITGSRGGNVALASLLTQLATLGLITDSTTA